MIDFHVDKGGSVPAYAQLVRQVREAMRLGLLRPGDRLPTVREVVTSCTVNAATVLKAYRELEMSGLVESRQGSGTFVTGTLGSADPHVMARLRTGLARWLDQAREAGLEDEDVQALVTSVLAQQAAGARAEIPVGTAGRRYRSGTACRRDRRCGVSEEPIALEARGLTKRYRDVVALSECSFQLPAHRIIALVGANGAGKSTLMSIAAGLLPATSGEILVAGRRVDAAPQDPPGRHRAPRRHPRPGQAALPRLHRRRHAQVRAAHQPRLGPAAGGERGWIASTCRSGGAAAGCPAGSAPRSPSRSRSAAARDVLLLDEPLANLDPVARSEVTGELIAEVAESGMTVMLSTHIVAELAGVGEYLLLLAAGRPVLAGDIEELVASHVRLTGPRADLPPCPGEIVQAQHAERQSTFIVRLPGQAVRPRWSPRVEQRADDLRGTDAHLPQDRPRSRRRVLEAAV